MNSDSKKAAHYVIEMEEDPNWYKARQGQREGMVPANYISLHPHPWYIPKCSRKEAEARLLEVDPETNLDVQPDGAFILRQSENEFGQFSISVK
ncbi:unnamed protein product [Dicrocoelium dendriticum]|nr:unnamed protein product [Dicrocoelium dendriticum]